MSGELLPAAKYGSNLSEFEFTLSCCALMLALFKRLERGAWRECVALRALGRPPINQYMRAVRDAGWLKERAGCDRMCPKSWMLEATPTGVLILAAFHDNRGDMAARTLKAGLGLHTILTKRGDDVIHKSLELAADLPPAECIGNREWRQRLEREPADA